MRRADGKTVEMKRYAVMIGFCFLPREQAQTDFASLVARLEVQSGIPRKVWLWDRSLMYTMTAYATMHEFAAAFSAGGGSSRRMIDELDDALRNLARTKAMIVLRVRESRERKDAEGDA